MIGFSNCLIVCSTFSEIPHRRQPTKGATNRATDAPPQPKPKTRERRLATEPQRKHLQRFRRQTVGWIFQHRPRAGEETPEPERPEGEDRPSERGASDLELCQDPGRRAWSPEKVQRQWLGRDILQSQDEAQHRPAVACRYLQPPRRPHHQRQQPQPPHPPRPPALRRQRSPLEGIYNQLIIKLTN